MIIDWYVPDPGRPYHVQILRTTELETGPFCTKLTDVLLQDLVTYRSREIGCYNDRVALKFCRHPDKAAAEIPVKFQSDWKSVKPNLMASKLQEILR